MFPPVRRRCSHFVPGSPEGTEDPRVMRSALVELIFWWNKDVNPKKLSPLFILTSTQQTTRAVRYISSVYPSAPETQQETWISPPHDFRPFPNSSKMGQNVSAPNTGQISNITWDSKAVGEILPLWWVSDWFQRKDFRQPGSEHTSGRGVLGAWVSGRPLGWGTSRALYVLTRDVLWDTQPVEASGVCHGANALSTCKLLTSLHQPLMREAGTCFQGVGAS